MKYKIIIFLIIAFAISILYSDNSNSICCDDGCYPDANVCDSEDGRGYVGCQDSNLQYYAPNTILGDCQTCECADTSTCEWSAMNDLCQPGNICYVSYLETLPETSECFCPEGTTLCFNGTCSTDCRSQSGCLIGGTPDCDIGEGCGCEECNIRSAGCGPDLICINGLCQTRPTDCSLCTDCDGYVGSCTFTECSLCGDNCYYQGRSFLLNDCLGCEETTLCEDYEDNEQVCNADSCNIGNCNFIGGECITQCKGGEILCADGLCRGNCTIVLENLNCNNNTVCDSDESCSCSDCNDQQSSCEAGLTCDYDAGYCSSDEFLCEQLIEGTQVNCEHGETGCWAASKSECCGDIPGETWEYSTNLNFNNILIQSTCLFSMWYDRRFENITYYSLSILR